MPMTDPDPHPVEPPGLVALWWYETRVALSFLTRFPVHGNDLGDTSVGQAARGFPVAGVAVGIAGSAVLILAHSLGLPMDVAALLAVGTMIFATGGLHEDGLADMADGFGGGSDRDAVLAIMRDSRIGTFGVLALLLTLGLRVAALADIAEVVWAALALIAAAAGSRAVLPVVLYNLASARPDGLGQAAGRPERRQVIDSAALGAAIVFIGLGPAGGILAIAAVALTTAYLSSLAERRIGGQTGDVLGAIQQAAEVAILLAAVATHS
jgi:adenosylcobinamide-GDP ribazoletransferase